MERQNSTLNNNGNGNKVKLMCSYGGKIQSRPTDHQLSYVGGDTKILAVDRAVKFSEIAAKLNSLCNRSDNTEFAVKYQLPGEDLDSLVSLIDDDDVEHMMVEYDRMQRISTKPTRLRLFIFDVSAPHAKTGFKEPVPVNPDYLFGFDKEYQPSNGPPLDLLQIPGVVIPESYGHVAGRGDILGVSGGSAAGQVVYRFPAVVGGGVYQTGGYAYGAAAVGQGEREFPVYSVVPIMPSMAEQRMGVSSGNNVEVKVNQRNF